jgi:hypothetical protein
MVVEPRHSANRDEGMGTENSRKSSDSLEKQNVNGKWFARETEPVWLEYLASRMSFMNDEVEHAQESSAAEGFGSS